MSMATRRGRVLALAGMLVVATGCAGVSLAQPPEPLASQATVLSSTTAVSSVAPVGPHDRYLLAVQAADRHGLEVWLEADLVKRWEQGPASFDSAVARLAALAKDPGVVGIKVADELGYHDGLDGSSARMRQFLDDTAHALRQAAPGKLLLVDMVVPALGCAPGLPAVQAAASSCRQNAAARYPALALSQLDQLFATRDIDVLDLSTSLQSDATYEHWGIGRDAAQRAAWAEAHRRGWDRLLRLQSRKALAHPGNYSGGAAQAQRDLRTFVDVPTEQGAAAVDVWTWRQTYQGQLVRLMNPRLQPNALWMGLLARHQAGVRMLTHFTPSSVESSVDTDLGVLAQAFTGVFVAAGTG